MQRCEAVVHGESCVRVELGEEDGDSSDRYVWPLVSAHVPSEAAVGLGMEESSSVV